MWKQGCGLLGSLTPNLRQEPLRHFVGVRRKKKAFCPRNHRLRANVRICANKCSVLLSRSYSMFTISARKLQCIMKLEGWSSSQVFQHRVPWDGTWRPSKELENHRNHRKWMFLPKNVWHCKANHLPSPISPEVGYIEPLKSKLEAYGMGFTRLWWF